MGCLEPREKLDLCLTWGHVVGLSPRKNEVGRIRELPDVSTAPMAHRLGCAEVGELAHPATQSIRLPHVNDVRAVDPSPSEDGDVDGRVSSFEASARVIRQEDGRGAGLAKHHVDPGDVGNVRDAASAELGERHEPLEAFSSKVPTPDSGHSASDHTCSKNSALLHA
jgi:hypothetical protein